DRGDAEPAGVQRGQRDRQPLALGPDQPVGLDLDAVEVHRGGGGRGQPHLLLRLGRGETRRVGRHEEAADPAGALTGAGEHRVEVRLPAVGHPGLGPVQAPAALRAGRAGAHRAGVAARVGLGQAVCPEQVAADQLRQPALALLLRAVVEQREAGQRLHRDADPDRRPAGPDLLQHLQVDLVRLAGAAVPLRERQAEQPRLAERAEHVPREQLGVADLADQVEQVRGVLGGQQPVDRHQCSRGDSSGSRRSSARAIERRCTSSGPSNRCIARCQAYMAASGVSSETPAPPCTWMARSMTFVAARGQATLAIETRFLAALLPCSSITEQAFWHSSRAWSISSRDSATCCCSMPWSASGPPNATREFALATIIASARSAAPSARMQWWIRPGPSLACAAANPPPSSPSTFAAGTRTPSNRTSAWPCWSCRPITGRSRTIVTPVVSTGTSTIVCCRYGAASGSVLPIVISSRQRGSSAPEVHHFRPVITYSSPSRS